MPWPLAPACGRCSALRRLDDLCRAGIARQKTGCAVLSSVPTCADGPSTPAPRVVEQRVGLFGAMGDVGPLSPPPALPSSHSRRRATGRRRRLLRQRMRGRPTPECCARALARRHRRAADVLAPSSFEAYRLLRGTVRDRDAAPAEVMNGGVVTLLTRDRGQP